MGIEHANCISVDGAGVLIRGASGAGKSDLSLRMIDDGAVLVADDYTDICAIDGQAQASPPDKIAGRIEVRGLGIIDRPFARDVTISLVVDLVELDSEERMPEKMMVELAGVEIPLICLWGFAASAPAKVRLALGLALEQNQ